MPTLHSGPSTDAKSQSANRARVVAAMECKRASRSSVFDSRLPLSWFRVLRAVISYVLLFSDIPRSGIGVRRLASSFHLLEADKFLSVGPWAYPVAMLHRNEIASLSVRTWSYKFDTTSVTWRAFAAFLKLEAFPPCVLYQSKRASKTLSGAVIFAMIDALPTALAQRHRDRHCGSANASQLQQQQQPVVLALRTSSNFFDKLHHFVLPTVFVNPTLRTNQAFYYPPQLAMRADFRICFDRPKNTIPRLCENEWTDFARSCAANGLECRSVGQVAHHVVARMRQLQAKYPNAVVDLTVLESADSIRTVRGGLCHTERRDTDVSTILRVRKCSTLSTPTSYVQDSSNDTCETIVVTDYRYETTIITTDVEQWFALVATLRAVGQTYFCLRVAALLVSCYAARAAEDKYASATLWKRLRAACLLIVRVPSQCVIHGSRFPILCYICAHLVDAPFMYEIAGDRLAVLNGLFSVSFWDFCLIAAVQMRSLWLLTFTVQTALALFTRCRDWSPPNGVLGVSVLAVGAVSSCTLFGQFRTIAFRDTAVLSIDELPSASSMPQVINHATQLRGTGNSMLEGVFIDVKLVLYALALVLAHSIFKLCIVLPLQCVYQRWKDCHRVASVQDTTTKPHQWYVVSLPTYIIGRTPVPYSAGALWPITAACTKWGGSIFSDAGAATPLQKLNRGISRLALHSVTPEASTTTVRAVRSSASWLIPQPREGSSHSSNSTCSISTKQRRITDSQTTNRSSASTDTLQWPIWPQTGQSIDTLQFVQEHMEHMHTRHPDVDAVVALFNLVMMSDPLVFCALKAFGPGQQLAYYATTASESSATPSRIVLLPQAIAATCFLSSELTLLATMSSRDLEWSDLIHCG